MEFASSLDLSFRSPIIFLFSNTLLCSMLVLSVSGMFSMLLHILLNVLPCSGFMKKSASMFVVGQKATLTSTFFYLICQEDVPYINMSGSL